MSERLVNALARSGLPQLYELAGRGAVDLLERLESRALTAHSLARIIVDRVGAMTALRDEGIRDVVLQTLKPSDAENLATLLGNEKDGDYGFLANCNFRTDETKLEILASFFAAVYEPLAEVEKPASVLVEPPYTLFPHQRVAAISVREKLSTGRRRVLLHMPTGSGKTRTASTALVDIIRGKPDGQIIVWLAHSEELCDQAFDEISRAFSSIGPRPLKIYRHFGDSRIRDLAEVRDGVIVAGLQLLFKDSLSNQASFLALAARTCIVVMDEAHQATAPTYSHLLNLFQLSPKVGILGLSATPGRSLTDVRSDLSLANFFDRQKVKLNVEGYANPIDYLVEAGYLAQIEFVPLPFGTSGDLNLSDEEVSKLSEGFDVPARIISELASNDARNLLIVESILSELSHGGKIIVFALSVEHATLIASVLRFRGIKAAAVTSATALERRRQIIQQYRDTDELMVLCNYGVLTTGFDAPRTNVAVIARPTTSVVLYSQMVGRAARGPRAGGNATCRILTVVDQIPGFRDLVDGFEFWDDIWENEQ
jgi:DNA repair protein RadD